MTKRILAAMLAISVSSCAKADDSDFCQDVFSIIKSDTDIMEMDRSSPGYEHLVPAWVEAIAAWQRLASKHHCKESPK